MDENDHETLWRQMGESTVALMSRAPGLVAHAEPGCWMATSDIDSWTANWIAIYRPDDASLRALQAWLDQAAASGRTTSVVVAEAAREAATPLFAGRPMRLDGNPPIMVWDDRPIAPNTRAYGGEVRQGVSGEDGASASELVAASFEVDPAGNRLLMAGMLDQPAMRLFTATSDTLDSVYIDYTSGPVTYVHILATAPDRQRRGSGRAVMTHAMELAIASGTDRFFLMASSAGQPLYRALGFETIELPEFWEMHPR